jgi:ABC-type branched-subunit amino acid transport system ATPase component
MPKQPNEKSQQSSQPQDQGQQSQQTQALQSRAQACGMDWSFLQTLAPIVADAILKIVEAFKNRPKAAAGLKCEDELETALKAAHEAAVANLCASCEACCVAGVDHCD